MNEQSRLVWSQFDDGMIPEEIRQQRWENRNVKHASTGNKIKGDPAATADFPEIERKNEYKADSDDGGEKAQRMKFCGTESKPEAVNSPADNRQKYPPIPSVNP